MERLVENEEEEPWPNFITWLGGELSIRPTDNLRSKIWELPKSVKPPQGNSDFTSKIEGKIIQRCKSFINKMRVKW